MMKVLVPSPAGGHVVDVEAVAGAHWEKSSRQRVLIVHYIGGRFDTFEGDHAEALWRVIAGEASAVDLAAPPPIARSA